MLPDWLQRCSCLRGMCECVARRVNSSKTSAAVDGWLATMSAHETRTGMVGPCRGGTCRPERWAWKSCVVWLATNVGHTVYDWQLYDVASDYCKTYQTFVTIMNNVNIRWLLAFYWQICLPLFWPSSCILRAHRRKLLQPNRTIRLKQNAKPPTV